MRKKRNPNVVLRKRCDALWAQVVKWRAKSICEQCGRKGDEAHHMRSRTAAFTRHDLRNGVYLCKGCHLRFHNRESLSLWQWFEANRPDDFAFIQANLHTLQRKPDYPKILAILKAQVEVIEE